MKRGHERHELGREGGYANAVVRHLKSDSEVAAWLEVRARGKTATIGLTEDGDWVPLLRLANGSASFNVMDLQVRHKRRWAPTGIRGIPDLIAQELIGPLRFTWEFAASAAEAWQRTSDQRH